MSISGGGNTDRGSLEDWTMDQSFVRTKGLRWHQSTILFFDVYNEKLPCTRQRPSTVNPEHIHAS